jgi:hypothetical protein
MGPILRSNNAVLGIINGTPAESGKYRVDVVYNRTGGNCSVSSFSKVRSLTFYLVNNRREWFLNQIVLQIQEP